MRLSEKVSNRVDSAMNFEEMCATSTFAAKLALTQHACMDLNRHMWLVLWRCPT